MRNFVKYILALAVMGGGFYAAQQHRHPGGSPPRETLAARESADEASRGVKPELPERTSSSPRLPVAALADVDRVPLVGSDRRPASAAAKSPESASVTHQPTLRAERPAAPPPAGDALKTADATAAKPAASPQAEAKPKAKKQKKETSSRPADPPAGPNAVAAKPAIAEARPKPKSRKTAPETTPRRHRIAEGDTLTRLAEKYLGSRDRYLDLFQANAEVLFDPRLIPIGVEIVIPDRDTVVAQAAPAPAPSADAAPDAERPTGESPDATK